MALRRHWGTLQNVSGSIILSLFDVVQQIVVGMVGEDDSLLLIMNKCKWEKVCVEI